MMKVYVATLGVYSDQAVGGVFDSPERAMGHYDEPGMVWIRDDYTTVDGRVMVTWRNDRDMDSAVRIEPFFLTETGPTRRADRTETVP